MTKPNDVVEVILKKLATDSLYTTDDIYNAVAQAKKEIAKHYRKVVMEALPDKMPITIARQYGKVYALCRDTIVKALEEVL